jgi:hypothetical protein
MQSDLHVAQQVVLQIWKMNAFMNDQKHHLPSLWDKISQRSRNNQQRLDLSIRIIATYNNFTVQII